MARYNQMLQHQTIQHTLNSPLTRSKTEILRVIESLTEKQYMDVVDLMLPVGAYCVISIVDINLEKRVFSYSMTLP